MEYQNKTRGSLPEIKEEKATSQRVEGNQHIWVLLLLKPLQSSIKLASRGVVQRGTEALGVAPSAHNDLSELPRHVQSSKVSDCLQGSKIES